jgi:hypothetical protein
MMHHYHLIIKYRKTFKLDNNYNNLSKKYPKSFEKQPVHSSNDKEPLKS